MYANYHTHTWRCGHASGTEREYIETAIERGLTILGFSDHTPQFYDSNDYPTHQKMRPEMFGDYVTTILDLRREYAREIEIHLGLEVEYFPRHFEKLMDFIAPYPLEYMLLGQHSIYNGEPGDPFVFVPTDREEHLRQYVDQCIEALGTGRFLYFAHPDVIHFTGNEKAYRREMTRLAGYTAKHEIPLEINLHGLFEGRYYPNALFWEIAAAEGNIAILGSDAHSPEGVLQKEAVTKAEAMAERLGMKLLRELKI